MPRLSRIACWPIAVAAVLVPAHPAAAAAEVRLDKSYLMGLLEKVPPCPFDKAGRYHGHVDGFQLLAIDPRTRQFVVSCRITGEFHERSIVRKLSRPDRPGGDETDGRWRAFQFDVRAAVNIEPGADGTPRFRVDVDEVKRRELEGVAGLLAKAMDRQFDAIVTRVADGKAATLSDRLNTEVVRRISAFREYGILCAITYSTNEVVLRFDLTRLRLEGVAGHIFPNPQPGTVPLYRWRNPTRGDHFYSLDPSESDRLKLASEGIAGHVYAQPIPGAIPLYRWAAHNEHFYTTARDGERGGRAGLRLEGVACYLLPEPKPGTVPLYRFVDPRNGNHFYTTHPHAEFAK